MTTDAPAPPREGTAASSPLIDFSLPLDALSAPAWLSGELGTLNDGRRYRFVDADNRVANGEVEGGALSLTIASFPHHEFTLVRRGQLRLVIAGHEELLEAGDAAVVPKGLACLWSQSADLQRVFMIHEGQHAAVAPRKLARIAAFGPLGPGSAPPAESLLTEPPPVAQSRVDFKDESGQMLAGVWRCGAYRRKPLAAQQHELMQIVEGTPDVDGEDGTRLRSFAPGDIFFTAKGARYSLGSGGTFQKIFCVFKQAG
jgi:uncharacterized cupin superfamily protein